MTVTDAAIALAQTDDEGLLEWFLALSVEQRLAELECRVGMLLEARMSYDAQLSRNSEAP